MIIDNEIIGKRIYFKMLQEIDATEKYCNWLNDPEVNRYLETRQATIEDLKEYITKKNQTKDCLFLGIFDKKTKEHIGNLKLEPIDFQKKKAEFSMIIGNKDYWNKGIGTEATKLIMNYAFKILNIKEITLGVIPENKVAIKVYEKCGFKIKEIKKNVLNHNGKLFDKIIMEIKMENEPKTSKVFAAYTEIKTERAINWEENQSQEYKEYREKWEEYPKKLKIPEFPFHLDIEATNCCNLRCIMCARTLRVLKNEWRKSANIHFDVFKKIIDEGSENGLYAINLNQFGEPLLNPNLPEMIKYAKSKNILDVFFHTNGVLLNKGISRRLIESGLDRIMISFDTPYKEKYEKIRIGSNYKTVLQNVKDFFTLREEMNSTTPLIRINMIKFPDITEKEINDMKKLFLGISDSIGLLEYEETNPKKKEINKFSLNYKSKFICPQLLTRLSILEDGTVTACCTDLDAKLKLGNVNNQTLKEIWNSPKLKTLRNLHFSGNFYKIPTCLNCDWAIKEDKKMNEIKQTKK